MISFDVPNVPEDYVHRIGRTARAKAEGDAFVLVSQPEEKLLAEIERHIGQRLPALPFPISITRNPRRVTARENTKAMRRPNAHRIPLPSKTSERARGRPALRGEGPRPAAGGGEASPAKAW